MALAPDPADRVLDAQADGAFGGKKTVGTDCTTNRRAGYTDPLGMALRVAEKGGTLAAGEGALIIKSYEERLAAVTAERDALVEAIEHELILADIGTFKAGDNPKAALHKLMVWYQGLGAYFEARERDAN